jgi:hypothetical protein
MVRQRNYYEQVIRGEEDLNILWVEWIGNGERAGLEPAPTLPSIQIMG